MKTLEEIEIRATELYPAESFARFEIRNNIVNQMRQEAFIKGYEESKNNQWIDVYDHSPESNIEVLGFDGRLISIIIFNDEKYHDLNGVELDEVQYWMYMPEKPKS